MMLSSLTTARMRTYKKRIRKLILKALWPFIQNLNISKFPAVRYVAALTYHLSLSPIWQTADIQMIFRAVGPH